MDLYLRIARLALGRPRVLPALFGACWAFRDRRWYRRLPFLPLPPASYLRWRLDTAYGSPDHVPSADELERYLRWTARMRTRITAAGGGLHR